MKLDFSSTSNDITFKHNTFTKHNTSKIFVNSDLRFDEVMPLFKYKFYVTTFYEIWCFINYSYI